MKLHHLLLIPAFACCMIVAAQTTTVKIGWFDFDSVLQEMAGYKATVDSAAMHKWESTQAMNSYRNELASKQYRYDSLHIEWHPVFQLTQAAYLRDLEAYLAKYEVESAKESARLDSLVAAYPVRLAEAAKKIALKNGCSVVLNALNAKEQAIWSAPGTTFIDLTAELIAEINN
jgi:Skp family chaperone for outer membrane proteins